MPAINFAKREISCKLVYYGPGLSGKTTNLEVVHKRAPAGRKGDLTNIATEGDRTLFFDYMPLDLGKVGGMKTRFQLYTVPGQQYYNATRRLVLRGADGVVFVADSQEGMMQENLESFENLLTNLRDEGIKPEQIPMVIQWNKRDLPNVIPAEELDKAINKFGSPTVEASAVTGEGVFLTLRKAAELVLLKLNTDWGFKDGPRPRRPEPAAEVEATPVAEAAAEQAPADEAPAEPRRRRRRRTPRAPQPTVEQEPLPTLPRPRGATEPEPEVTIVTARPRPSRFAFLPWLVSLLLLSLLAAAVAERAGYLAWLTELVGAH